MHPKHKKNFQSHARRRALERYQVSIDPLIIRDMEKMIKQNIGILHRKRMSTTRSLIDIEYSGKSYRVIYSRKWQKIVTFLPMEDENELNKTN